MCDKIPPLKEENWDVLLNDFVHWKEITIFVNINLDHAVYPKWESVFGIDILLNGLCICTLTETKPCDSSPCQNGGTCNLITGNGTCGYECVCKDCFSGDQCQKGEA